VYVDVLSLIGERRSNIRGEEGAVIDATARLVASVAVKAGEVSDIDELKEYSSGVIETDSSELDADLIVDGEEAFEEILRALEKAGVIRTAGNKVRLRK